MLLQLSSKQITEQWDVLREALPTEVNPRHILQEALLMNSSIWLDVRDGERVAFVVTRLEEDRQSGERFLYVALLVSLGKGLSESILTEGLSTLYKYAIGKGCKGLTFHTDNKALLGMAKRLGGTIESFVTIPLGGV